MPLVPLLGTPTPSSSFPPSSTTAPPRPRQPPHAQRTMPALPFPRPSRLAPLGRSSQPGDFEVAPREVQPDRGHHQQAKRLVMNPPESFMIYAASLQPDQPPVSGPLSIGHGGQAIMSLPTDSEASGSGLSLDPETQTISDTSHAESSSDPTGDSSSPATSTVMPTLPQMPPVTSSPTFTPTDPAAFPSDEQSTSSDPHSIQLGTPSTFSATSSDQPAPAPLALSGTAPLSISPSEAVVGSSPLLSLSAASSLNAGPVGSVSTGDAVSQTPPVVSGLDVHEPSQVIQAADGQTSNGAQSNQAVPTTGPQGAMTTTLTADGSTVTLVSAPSASTTDLTATGTLLGQVSSLSTSNSLTGTSSSSIAPSSSTSASHAHPPFIHTPFFIAILVIASLSAIAILATLISFCLHRRAARHPSDQFSDGLSNLVQDMSRTQSRRSARSRRSSVSARRGMTDEEKAVWRRAERAEDFAVQPGQGDVRNPYLHTGEAVGDSTGLPEIDLIIEQTGGEDPGNRLHKERGFAEMQSFPPSGNAAHADAGSRAATGMQADGTLPPQAYGTTAQGRLEVKNGAPESVVTEEEELERYYKKMADLPPQHRNGQEENRKPLGEPRFLGLNGAGLSVPWNRTTSEHTLALGFLPDSPPHLDSRTSPAMQAYQYAGMPRGDERLQVTSYWVPSSGGQEYLGPPFPSPVDTEIELPPDEAESAPKAGPDQASGSTWASTIRESLFSAVGLGATAMPQAVARPGPGQTYSPIPPVTIQPPTVRSESEAEDPYTRPLRNVHRRPAPSASLLPGNGTPNPHSPSPIPGLPGFTPETMTRSAFLPSSAAWGTSRQMALSRSQSSAGSRRSRSSVSTFTARQIKSGHRRRRSQHASTGRDSVGERYKRRAREGRRK